MRSTESVSDRAAALLWEQELLDNQSCVCVSTVQMAEATDQSMQRNSSVP